MIATSDGVLEQCRPPNISWDRYMEHCELAVNVPDLHSDEYSTDDEQLANEERRDNKRPERITRTNSVIKIREKNGGPQGSAGNGTGQCPWMGRPGLSRPWT